MKVLQIPNYYYPHIGGIESTCQYLSEGISDEYEVQVVCFSEDKKDKIENFNNVRIYKAGVQCNIARQALSLSYARILKQRIKEWKPDIIHFHYPNPFVTAILLAVLPSNVKLYLHWHLDITKQKKIYPFVKPLENRLLKRADHIVATSPNYRDSSKPLLHYLYKTSILPSAIDVSKFQLSTSDQLKVRQIKDAANGKKIVLYVGRHVRHKGIEALIEAETFIKEDCVIMIGGEGPLTEKVKRECHSKRVKFLGRLPEADLKCYYHAADVFAFPSYTKAEAFGLTLVEAMYCYAPPVTFTISGSGVNWVSLNKKTGLEVPNLNIQAYAEAIDTLLSNDSLRLEYAQQGHQRVLDNFIVEKEISILKSDYKNLNK